MSDATHDLTMVLAEHINAASEMNLLLRRC
jgi:hypothetical protein